MHLFPGERQRRQAQDFGPVTLVWSSEPTWQPSVRSPVQHVELHVRNTEALTRVSSLMGTEGCFHPFIMDPGGNVIWTEDELRAVCERRQTG